MNLLKTKTWDYRTEPNGTLWKAGRMIFVLIITMSLAVVFLYAPTTAYATKTIAYRTVVVDVVDGDTIVVSNRVFNWETYRGLHTLELDCVDAPTLEQSGGQEAKTLLERLLLGKEVLVTELTDRDQSKGAWVFVGSKNENANLRLIEEGRAKIAEPRAHYAIKSKDPKKAYSKMKEAQRNAKERKAGIWGSTNHTPLEKLPDGSMSSEIVGDRDDSVEESAESAPAAPESLAKTNNVTSISKSATNTPTPQKISACCQQTDRP